MARFACAVLISLALTACAGPAADEGPNPDAVSVGSELEMLAQDGRDIAEAQCASCHSVGSYGESPNAAAPPFRTVLSRHHDIVLEEELINGARVTHEMPDFQFNPQSVDALLAYMRSIQEPVAQEEAG